MSNREKTTTRKIRLREQMVYGESAGENPIGPFLLDRASWLMDQLPNGPWRWSGDKDDVKLMTRHGGGVFLMGVGRSGMKGGQFKFQYFHPDKFTAANPPARVRLPIVTDYPQSRLVNGNEGAYVSRAEYDQNCIVDIDHPLAQLIQMLPEIIEEAERNREEVEILREQLLEIQVSRSERD